MKPIRFAFAVLAAITGIGGAFGVQAKSNESGHPILAWYTAGGHFFTLGTIAQMEVLCAVGTLDVCLYGTTPNPPHAVLTIIEGFYEN
jgi:hypothetical protein